MSLGAGREDGEREGGSLCVSQVSSSVTVSPSGPPSPAGWPILLIFFVQPCAVRCIHFSPAGY